MSRLLWARAARLVPSFVLVCSFLVGAPASAQDADGDGVPDTHDLCPTTSAGLTVDRAGCDAFCEVVDATSDVFLRSRLLEVGTADPGSFGSSIVPPAGWHPRALTNAMSDNLLGFVADPNRTDWSDYQGDFFTPGSPVEGFGITVGGTSHFNAALLGTEGIAGTFTGTRVECRPAVCGVRGGGSAYWSGSVDGIEVDQVYSVMNEGLFILVEVTLTNTTGTDQVITYARNVDPDNMQPVTGDYTTTNTVVRQGDGSASSIAQVTATTSMPDSYIALVSSDPDARVSLGGFDNRNPAAIWDCSQAGLLCGEGDSNFVDEAISLAVRKTVPAGGSVQFSFAYTLSDVEVSIAAPCTVPSVCGDGVIEGAETCDDGNTMAGDGCSDGCTEEPGYGCMGTPSTCAPICGDGVVLTPETCDDGNATAGDGCSALCETEPGNVCIGVPSVCGPCADTMAGDATDLGCSMAAPYCIGSGPMAFCAPCDDDSSSIDLGCADPTRVCDTSGAPVHVCVACEDSVPGGGVDNGCSADRPFCGTTMSGAPTCVQCLGDDDCGVGTVCSMTGECVPGCTDAADCSGSTPICDTSMRMCVECTEDSHCPAEQTCRPSRTCGAGDTDGDLVADDVDEDDDNDGIPDVVEIDPSLVGDSDMNGILDYQDSGRVSCPDTSPSDGVCDELPRSIDLDGDGLPNHLDLDADGDGIADLVEAGGEDGNGDGLVDDFMDGDGDGLHDPYLSMALPTPSSDGDSTPDFLDRDADGDGVPDTIEGGVGDANGDGVADDSSDSNGDGIADALTGAGAAPTPDTDSDGTPDYQDVDADGDGIADATEATDADQDGEPDLTPSGTDSDGDGIDDTFDPSCVVAADCGGVIGTVAPLPNTDGDGPSDWRDIDSDGDGITDAVECPRPEACVDTDGDGTPDYLSSDADGDGIPDATEGHDADSNGVADTAPSGSDTDGDGLDDAFDPDCAAAEDCGGVIGVVAPIPDLDEDLLPNFQDPDDDNDGLSTATEQQDADEYTGPAADAGDIDEDGLPNWYDPDTDGDEVSDRTESGGDGDEDGNGILDYMDPNFAPADSDGDTVIDRVECPPPMSPAAGDCPDSDGDGVPDHEDDDDDGDGIPTRDEEAAGPDSDGDGVPNRIDLDSDDDGILDTIETGVDTDGDGIADAYDLDADADGILDVVEGGGSQFDTDADGRIDGPTDSNGNGVDDRVDPQAGGMALPVPDTDGDGVPDFQDVDADGDGVPDGTEGHDADADGVPDVTPSGTDANRDGVDDAYDPNAGGTAASLPDFDGDERADFQDDDDDGDSVATADELGGGPNAEDTDGDGQPDYLDTDDDNDGIDTETEVADGGGLEPANEDVDEDGVPNWRDPDSDGDGIADGDEPGDDNNNGVPDYLESPDEPTTGGLAGGALCATNGPAGPGPLALSVLMALGLLVRRRKL